MAIRTSFYTLETFYNNEYFNNTKKCPEFLID